MKIFECLKVGHILTILSGVNVQEIPEIFFGHSFWTFRNLQYPKCPKKPAIQFNLVVEKLAKMDGSDVSCCSR